MVRTHQPGEAVFRSILPRHRLEAVPGVPAVGPTRRRCRRADSSRTLPDQGQGALGREADAAQTPGGSHLHGDVRRFLHRPGRQFDGDKVKAYPPGSVVVLPGNTSHFHWAKSGEYVTQVTAIGPLGLEYMNPTTIRGIGALEAATACRSSSASRISPGLITAIRSKSEPTSFQCSGPAKSRPSR